MRTALLLGATGLVGSRCLEHLLSASSYERITCLVRRSSLSACPPPPRVSESGGRLQERVVDFDALGDIEPVDDVFCAIGSTMKKAGSKAAFRHVDYEIPLRVIERAVKAGAKRVALVSSVGADATSSNFYLATKGELEDAIGALPLRAFHVFRPSFLVGERTESRPGEVIGGAVFRAVSGLLFGGLRKYRPISVDDVGHAMVSAILRPDTEPPRQIHQHDEILALARS